MKLTFVLLSLSLALGPACKKKDADKSEPAAGAVTKPTEPNTPAPPAKSGRKIPNSSGLVVDAPAKWLDNGIGGAAGMHLDADAGMFTVRETSAEEAAKPFDQYKKETEEMMFQKWVSSEPTADGFKVVYLMDKIVMENDEPKVAGSTVAFNVRRKIGDTLYDCSGSASTPEIATEAVELCTRIAP